jgi:hypothetical protein
MDLEPSQEAKVFNFDQKGNSVLLYYGFFTKNKALPAELGRILGQYFYIAK